MPEGTCSIEGCDRKPYCRGWCQKHYVRWLHHGDPNVVLKGGYAARPALDRFLAKIKVDPDTGCWLWQGQPEGSGYCYFSGDDGRNILIHRWSHLHFKGPIAEDCEIDHTCHSDDLCCLGGVTCPHRRCGNPDHLEVVTHRQNMERSEPARRTHCPRGHPYEGENLYITREGWRTCRTCKLARMREWNERQREKARIDRAK